MTYRPYGSSDASPVPDRIRHQTRSTLPPGHRPDYVKPVGHYSSFGSSKAEADLKSCRHCLERVVTEELDDCLGCGSVDLCSTCMSGPSQHDCNGTMVDVIQAQERSKICIA